MIDLPEHVCVSLIHHVSLRAPTEKLLQVVEFFWTPECIT